MENTTNLNENDMKLASSLSNELTILLQEKDTESIRAIVSNIDEQTLNKVKKQLRAKELNLLSSILKVYPYKKSEEFKKKFELIMKKISLKEVDKKSQETVAICATLTVEQIEEFITENPMMAGSLLGKVQPIQLKEFLNNQTASKMTSVLSIKENDIDPKDFALAIDSFILSKQESLFQENLQGMTKSLSLEAERQIYKKLKVDKKDFLIKSLSKTNFPKFLVPNLPPEDLKLITKGFELEKTISFLNAVIDEDLFNFWLNITSESGTQKRELINSEIKRESELKTKIEGYYVAVISSLKSKKIENNLNIIIENYLKGTYDE